MHAMVTSRTTRVTGSVISTLAEVALKLRLSKNSGVKVLVKAEPTELLTGRVPYVKVVGRKWASPTGRLTCQKIEATVSDCSLDFASVVSRRKLVLTDPAKGTAMVALNTEDFGSFLTHPFLKPPKVDDGEQFLFSKENVSINSDSSEIIFYGSYAGNDWTCTLSKGPESSKALIKATPVNISEDREETLKQVDASLCLTNLLTEYFNDLVFELDGTFLTFENLLITSKGGTPSILFALAITVRKFPSPGLDF